MKKHEKHSRQGNREENEIKNRNGKKEKTLFRFFIKIAIVIILAASIIGIFYLVSNNYVRNEITDKTNFIINNNNVTTSLQHELFVQDGVVYVSMADMNNFFDNTITYDEQYDHIITCSEKKIASLPIGKNVIQINSANVTIKAGVIEKDDTYFIPISELSDVYNISTTYIEGTNIVTVDSLDREYSVATTTKNVSVKYKPTAFSRTLAKVEQGSTLIIANRSEFPVPDGWTRVRTEDGILGYVKLNQMGQINQIRSNMEDKPKIEGKVSLVWDYYSTYVYAPDRDGTTINGVNVVSPTFFRVGEGGEVLTNIEEQGKSYIDWAKQNGYEIWPMLSNENLSTSNLSTILRDYALREKLINKIIDNIVTYQLDGINVDFEGMYEADKDYFSRFLIELEPRLNEIGVVLSVDVTAPDGAPDWSLCYDRYTIAKVADYIIFMAYDQYGASSTEAGTTAGCGWVEENIQKFLGQEAVPDEKLILAIPFYTRLWEEENGEIISRPTVSMKDIEEVLPDNVERKWDENLKQYYVEYEDHGATHKMWIEDEESIEAKLNLIEEYHLAGAAFWEKDMEDSDIWNLVSEKLGT